ncbi:phosphatase PAP2 family protein [Streptomyces andamanensis]|uniref:Phosphatase PAP2 family protein n=1 Tax=Streptomyces andamanensis TaxID=1565035 RepID=A0ABV8TBD7_9ACTN
MRPARVPSPAPSPRSPRPPHPSRRPPARRAAAVRLAAVLGLCAAVPAVLVALRWRPLTAFDGAVARAAHRRAVAEPGITRACRVLTDWVWDPLTLRLLCAVVAVWLVRRAAAWRTAAWLVGTCALGTLLQQGLKAALGRDRPVWPDPVDSAAYASFPSGHAMTATVVCGLFLRLLHQYGAGRGPWSTAVALAVLSVAGVGLTRVWLGVHWPSDVLGGWLLGAAVVAAACAVPNGFPARGD